MPFCIGWVKNFDEIALSCTIKEIEANFCFSIFGENSKWLPFLGTGNFFENCQYYISQIPYGSKISTKSLYLAWLSIRSKFVFFHFSQKFENSKWPPFLGRGNFLKIAKSTFLRYPLGRKFRRNHSILQG